jgi:hypothetical protein
MVPAMGKVPEVSELYAPKRGFTDLGLDVYGGGMAGRAVENQESRTLPEWFATLGNVGETAIPVGGEEVGEPLGQWTR